jgi:hypothetical protein
MVVDNSDGMRRYFKYAILTAYRHVPPSPPSPLDTICSTAQRPGLHANRKSLWKLAQATSPFHLLRVKRLCDCFRREYTVIGRKWSQWWLVARRAGVRRKTRLMRSRVSPGSTSFRQTGRNGLLFISSDQNGENLLNFAYKVRLVNRGKRATAPAVHSFS